MKRTITAQRPQCRVFGLVLDHGHSVTIDVEDERMPELQMLVDFGEVLVDGMTKAPAPAPKEETELMADVAPQFDHTDKDHVG